MKVEWGREGGRRKKVGGREGGTEGGGGREGEGRVGGKEGERAGGGLMEIQCSVCVYID